MGLQNADPGFIFLSKMFLSRLVAAERSEAALGFPWFLMSDAG